MSKEPKALLCSDPEEMLIAMDVYRRRMVRLQDLAASEFSNSSTCRKYYPDIVPHKRVVMEIVVILKAAGWTSRKRRGPYYHPETDSYTLRTTTRWSPPKDTE